MTQLRLDDERTNSTSALEPVTAENKSDDGVQVSVLKRRVDRVRAIPVHEEEAPIQHSFQYVNLFWGVWAIGCFVTFVPMLVAIYRKRRLLRTSIAVQDRECDQILSKLRRSSGIVRTVFGFAQILMTGRIGLPITLPCPVGKKCTA